MVLKGLQKQILPSSFHESPASCCRRLSIKSVFNSWEILFHEWELSMFTVSILISLHFYTASNWLGLSTRVEFWCSLESNLSGPFICRLVGTYAHHMSQALQFVRTRQYASSWSTVRLQLVSRILHQYYFFQLKDWVSLSSMLLGRTMGQIVLPLRVSPFQFNNCCIPHTHLRLPWILSWNQFQSYLHRHRSVSNIFHLLCLWTFLGTMQSWLGKLGVPFLWI